MKDVFGYELKSLDMLEMHCNSDWRNITNGIHLRVDSKVVDRSHSSESVCDLDELLSQCKRDLIVKLIKGCQFRLIKLSRTHILPTIHSYMATFQINDTSIHVGFIADGSNELIGEANKALSETLLNNKH